MAAEAEDWKRSCEQDIEKDNHKHLAEVAEERRQSFRLWKVAMEPIWAQWDKEYLQSSSAPDWQALAEKQHDKERRQSASQRWRLQAKKARLPQAHQNRKPAIAEQQAHRNRSNKDGSRRSRHRLHDVLANEAKNCTEDV